MRVEGRGLWVETGEGEDALAEVSPEVFCRAMEPRQRCQRPLPGGQVRALVECRLIFLNRVSVNKIQQMI